MLDEGRKCVVIINFLWLLHGGHNLYREDLWQSVYRLGASSPAHRLRWLTRPRPILPTARLGEWPETEGRQTQMISVIIDHSRTNCCLSQSSLIPFGRPMPPGSFPSRDISLEHHVINAAWHCPNGLSVSFKLLSSFTHSSARYYRRIHQVITPGNRRLSRPGCAWRHDVPGRSIEHATNAP